MIIVLGLWAAVQFLAAVPAAAGFRAALRLHRLCRKHSGAALRIRQPMSS
jgi:hypothetical protein